MNTGTSPVVATIVVTPTFTNGGVSCAGPTKTFTITVDATPTVSVVYNAPSCSEKTFTVDVTNPVNGYSYSIDQPGNTLVFAPIVPSAGSPLVHFTGLTNGDGYIVTVTTNVAGCTATSSCATNPAPVSTLAPVSKVQEPAGNLTDSAAASNASIVKQSPESYRIALESLTKVNATPNPFTDRIRFNLVSSVSGIGSLELFNVMGQKVATVFEGSLLAGREIYKEYNVGSGMSRTLIYVFKVGGQSVTGKLISMKQ